MLRIKNATTAQYDYIGSESGRILDSITVVKDRPFKGINVAPVEQPKLTDPQNQQEDESDAPDQSGKDETESDS